MHLGSLEGKEEFNLRQNVIDSYQNDAGMKSIPFFMMLCAVLYRSSPLFGIMYNAPRLGFPTCDILERVLPPSVHVAMSTPPPINIIGGKQIVSSKTACRLTYIL